MRSSQRLICKAIGLISILGGPVALSACSAQEPSVPPDWPTDCVGRMQLSLPGKSDVAANSFKTLEDEYKVQATQPRFEFADGQFAGYSAQQYLGVLFVSHPLLEDQRRALLNAAKNGQQSAKAYVARKKLDSNDRPLVFESLAMPTSSGVAYRVNDALTINVALGSIVVRAVSRDSQATDEDVRRNFKTMSEGLMLRPFGELPKTHGVCFPSTFIRDDGREGRSIRTTYRLQDHPDVTIWLDDSSATGPAPEQDPEKFTAEYKTSFFWHQDYRPMGESWRSIWAGTKGIHMDGRKGLSSFVQLNRKDGTVDYGYLAVVRGDPDAKQDEPDLMLFVIRDAKNAIAKGIEPIDKDKLLEMARAITTSVKHRPVQ